ncbi:MAG: metalloregulator ArsR/SmtB family transcription factor [Deltaproteobacteria bacterium]|nr:metalloregulator ArsR/SmtB family transcription factor [Deltaproteobacteria bacterium]
MSIPKFLDIIKAISDENRLRAIMALRTGELCVCQIVELLQLAHSTVSKHMSILKQAGLVESRKKGRWVFYRLRDADETSSLAEQALSWACGAVSQDPIILKDECQLSEVLRLDPEELCRLKKKK